MWRAVEAKNETSPAPAKARRRRRGAPPLALTLALAALLALPAFASAASTLQVNGTTGADGGNCVASPCETIAYAIAQASAGDTIQVAAGHYEEQLTIDKRLTLEGDVAGGTEIGPLATDTVVPGSAITLTTGADGTVIRDLELRSAAQSQPTIGTSGGAIDDVAIEGVTQVGLGPSHVPSTIASGLELSVPTDGWSVTDSSFDADYMGILVAGDAENLTVSGSSFTHDRSGFYVQRTEPTAGTFVGEVDGLEITDCEFIEDQYRGLYFEGLSNATIAGVTVTKAGATAPTHPFGARAISLNLKGGDYENIKLVDVKVVEAENEGISIQVRGSADDSPTYQAHPATLDQVEITESTVVANDGPGIVVENSTQLGQAVISDSRIVGNARDGLPAGDTASGIDAWDEDSGAPTVEATDNWFGCNAGPSDALAGCDTVDGPVIADPWLVLTGEAGAAAVPFGGSTPVTAAIDSDSDGAAAGEAPPGTSVAFAAANGAVVPAAAQLLGGAAQTTYVAGLPGDAGLTATVDSQTVSVPVTVVAPPPAEEPKHEEPEREEAKPSTAPAPAPTAPVTIEPTETKTPPVVAPSGNVTVATVECASSSCQVEAKKPAITIGGRQFKVKVKVPATVAGGESAPVKVVLPKKAREALAEKGKGKVRVKLTVTTADGQTRTVMVTVVVKAKKGKKK